MPGSPYFRLPGRRTSCGCRSPKSGRPSLMIPFIRIGFLKPRMIRPDRSSSSQNASVSEIPLRNGSGHLLRLGCFFRCLGIRGPCKSTNRNPKDTVHSRYLISPESCPKNGVHLKVERGNPEILYGWNRELGIRPSLLGGAARGKWYTRQESNLRPLPSEGSALSS